MRHVVLVGMMGSGKSETGRALARLLGRRFVDCDEVVAALAQRSIPEIFASEGEAGFRRRESETLAETLAARDACVVATGGGAVTIQSNRTLLGSAVVCWLRAGPEVLARRVGDGSGRPLLAPGAVDDGVIERLRRLGVEREGWYREVADIIIDVEEISAARAAAAAVARLEASSDVRAPEVAT